MRIRCMCAGRRQQAVSSFGGGIRLIIRTGQSNAGTNNNGCEETENIKAPARFSPVSLFMMIYNFMYILPLYPALFWI